MDNINARTVRPYGKQELAQAYFPRLSGPWAWQKLKSLLLEYPGLTPIAQTTRRLLTPREVETIFKTLGEP